tara:strand:+ start:477 stop:971 length:495 start_codon:yes stop_codon:yes gene_type:complete
MDLNKLIIFISVISLILYLGCGNMSVLLTGFSCILIISYIKNDKSKQFESFFSGKDMSLFNLAKTEPTKLNPLMNVVATDPPNRPSAQKAYLPEVEKNINNFVKENANDSVSNNLFRDLGDEIELNHSMRQFYATANTTIPNDQKSFGDFCYGNMPSDKEMHNQ